MQRKKMVVERVQLELSAKEELTRLSDRLGIAQKTLMMRMIEWFANEPDTVQGAVLGLYPSEIRQEIGAMILARRNH